ncbi:MAG: YigZ family protein [Flaviflexus sp.]|nr:YigZ family protein [Flaviflexus sp.]
MELTLRAGASAEIEILRSRFIALLEPVQSEGDAREHLALARSEYPDARHHCSAWIVARDGQGPREHSNDDGEPSGTAGRPMLDVLRGRDLINVSAVVVRYFGGTLLGTGGLVRAYSEAVEAALGAAKLAERRLVPSYRLAVHPSEAGRLDSLLRSRDWEVEASWGNEVELIISGEGDGLEALLGAELGRPAQLTHLDPVTRYLPR